MNRIFLAVGAVANRAYRGISGYRKGLEDLNVYSTAAATRRKGPADLNSSRV